MGYLLRGGFPHSEIPGSKFTRNSPGLIAACDVLLRLLVPRHPPNALLRLILILSVWRVRRQRQNGIASARRNKPSDEKDIEACNLSSHDKRTCTQSLAFTFAFLTLTKMTAAKAGRFQSHRDETETHSFDSAVPAVGATLVELIGLEPTTSCLQSTRSTN